MADAAVIPGPERAPALSRAQRRLCAREEAWARLVKAGLAWQPEPDSAPEAPAGLQISSSQEWTAEQWKDAALLVLRVESALRGMGWTLGSPESHWVQFARCRPCWISQTALRPRAPGPWPQRRAFLDHFVQPLMVRCARGGCLRRLRASIGSLFGLIARDGLEDLEDRLVQLTPLRRWSPWTASAQLMEPPGPASILVREEALRRDARLI